MSPMIDNDGVTCVIKMRPVDPSWRGHGPATAGRWPGDGAAMAGRWRGFARPMVRRWRSDDAVIGRRLATATRSIAAPFGVVFPSPINVQVHSPTAYLLLLRSIRFQCLHHCWHPMTIRAISAPQPSAHFQFESRTSSFTQANE